MNIIDHIGLGVSDLGRALRFYGPALAPLGVALVMRVTKEDSGDSEAAGLGRNGKPSFWIVSAGLTTPRVHVAFAADDRAAVDAFYTAPLGAGGRDNGPPGIRAHYHPNYYGAFVFDPDGHNIEAVSHRPE